MKRGKGYLNDVLDDVLDEFKKYAETCETIRNMDDQNRFLTIAMAIYEYSYDSDKTLDEVLSELKGYIERINKFINQLHCS